MKLREQHDDNVCIRTWMCTPQVRCVCVCVCVVNIAPLRREWEKQKEAKQSYGGQREEEDWEESGEKKNQQKEQGRGIKQRWRRRVQEQENNQLRRGSGRRRQIRSKVVSEWSEFWPYGNLCDKKKSFTSYKLLLTTTLWLEILSMSGFCLQATIFVGFFVGFFF